MIGIIDYGMGNLRSVFNAFEFIGAAVEIISDPRDLKRATGIVLPGVGAFGDGIRNLHTRGFVGAMEEEVRSKGKPLLGICLGMQLLAKTGYEYGENPGLGWIDGVVDRLPVPEAEPRLRIPHIGWNDVRFAKRDGLFAGLGETSCFYFVHSYALRPTDGGIVSGECGYGANFVAAIETGNIYATQFHPEKSHRAGLTVLRNFIRLVK